MAVRFQTYAKNVKLAPGQTLHFQRGRGYYAGPGKTVAPAPAPPLVSENGQWTPTKVGIPDLPPGRTIRPPAPPPASADPYAALSRATLDSRATDLANAGLDPQLAEVRRQQALASEQAKAQQAAIQGFSDAAAGILKDIPGQVGAGYQAAAKTVGDVGTNVGGAIGADLAAKQQDEDAFAQSQGQGTGHTVDAQAAGDVVGYLGGVIPSESLAQQGAVAQAQAAGAVQIPLDAGAEQLHSAMLKASQENDQYAQQLIQLAAQFPGLKAQALQQLNQYELDKANYREQKKVSDANIAAQQADTARQNRAELANERAAGQLTTAQKAEYKYKYASLKFQSQKAAAAAKAAASKGKTIDVSASRLLGHIVYKDGTEDPSIKVQQNSTSGTNARQKALVNRAKATSAARVAAFKGATALLGKPHATDAKVTSAARALGKKVGQYVAGPSEKYGVPGGVFPPAYPGAPATTNNPARAARDGAGASNYADAQSKVWAQIDGDGLMARYGYSRQQVMSIVNQALARAGWKK
jgi:hypothetical protein